MTPKQQTTLDRLRRAAPDVIFVVEGNIVRAQLPQESYVIPLCIHDGAVTIRDSTYFARGPWYHTSRILPFPVRKTTFDRDGFAVFLREAQENHEKNVVYDAKVRLFMEALAPLQGKGTSVGLGEIDAHDRGVININLRLTLDEARRLVDFLKGLGHGP